MSSTCITCISVFPAKWQGKTQVILFTGKAFKYFCSFCFSAVLLDEIFLHCPIVSIQTNDFTGFTRGFLPRCLFYDTSLNYLENLYSIPPFVNLPLLTILSWAEKFINIDTYSSGVVYLNEGEKWEGNCESIWICYACKKSLKDSETNLFWT